MGFNCGIVGLPNVGKSTIFNALTSAKAEAANYPFCTVEPNTGIVPLPDERLKVLSSVANSVKIVPTAIEFVDIAGLVEGASKGEGLGNQFLANIREVDAIIHVVRCFDDPNITHVSGTVSPKRDVEIIETELMLADISSTEKRMVRLEKGARTGDKLAAEELALLKEAKGYLDQGIPLINSGKESGYFSKLGLLTGKPLLFLANVSEEEAALKESDNPGGYLGELLALAKERKTQAVIISGLVEAEISQLELSDRQGFLDAVGLEFSGLERLALAGYRLLNLVTFFTVGPKETHAWTCASGSLAPEAAGVIHTDFAKGFIRAEVISYADFVSSGGELKAKEKGQLRLEGKTYVVQDGDIMHFRFNV
jgi:GTP-binding protein YchF